MGFTNPVQISICGRNCIDETSSKLKLKQLQNWKPLYSANQVLEFKQIALSAARKYQEQR